MSDANDVAGIPQAALGLWQRLMAEALIPVHELFGQVKDYQKSIHQRSSDDEGVDPALAENLIRASMRLLGTLNDATPEATRQVIQAAVRYFVIEDDADSDLDSILGLDDDAEVVNAVLRHLGHDDWVVDVL